LRDARPLSELRVFLGVLELLGILGRASLHSPLSQLSTLNSQNSQLSKLSSSLLSLNYLHDAIPSVVAKAVRIEIAICKIVFQVSFFIVDIYNIKRLKK